MLCAANSSLTATGYDSVACLGFATFSDSSTIVADFATFYAASSSVITTGYDSVASMGFTSQSSRRGSTTANNATLYTVNSSVTATGVGLSVVSMGFGGTATITANNVTLQAASSNVAATGKNSVVSMGFASYGASPLSPPTMPFSCCVLHGCMGPGLLRLRSWDRILLLCVLTLRVVC